MSPEMLGALVASGSFVLLIIVFTVTFWMLRNIREIAVDTHILVNNSHGLALKALKEALQWRADRPDAIELDKENAKQAELNYENHMRKQGIVDGRNR